GQPGALGLRAPAGILSVYRRPPRGVKGETMWFATLLPLVHSFRRRQRPQRRRSARCRLTLESLEDRCVPSSYNIADLGTFNPSAINNAGQIAGAANGNAALWQNSTIIDLGTPGQANDLNDTGQVVGKGASGAFLWDS